MHDAKLIAAAIGSRKAWELIAAHFDVKEFAPLPKFWLPLINEWYERDKDAQSIDRSALEQQGELRIPNPKNRETFLGYLNDLPESPSPANTVQVALELKRYNLEMQLGRAFAERNQDRIDKILGAYVELRKATTLERVRSEWEDAVAVEDLFQTVGHENRIPLAPAKLNERIDGGALPGHNILILGRPEEGKSTAAINLGGSLVKREHRVLYIGNEDKIHVLKARMLCRITGLTFEEAERDPKRAAQLFRELGGEDRLLMTQLKRGTIDAVRKRVEEFEPQILIIDQIRNLMTGKGIDTDMTKKLEHLAIEHRQLLLEYNLIGVSVTQANDRTENARQKPPIWLGMGDIDSSRTGLPAQMDLIIGVGSDDDMKSRETRAFSLPKNKLSSKQGSHSGFFVTIDRARSRIY